MKHIILHTLEDTLKILPFLFIAFLIMEFIEHKFNDKSKKKIEKAGRFGPFFGALLGSLPQCGFSVMATNLYATRIITLGTLISIYLSTSDEMLPLLISKGMPFNEIIKILFLKVVIGVFFGFIIDFILRKKNKNKKYEIKDFCLEEHCDCQHGILKSALKHTISIFLFILLINLLLNIGMHFLGEDNINKLFLKNNLFSSFISCLIGLIPNCASSVILTELYLNGFLSFASFVAGLLTGSGVALLILFKVNKNIKENIKVILMLYLIGSLSGVLIELTNLLFIR